MRGRVTMQSDRVEDAPGNRDTSTTLPKRWNRLTANKISTHNRFAALPVFLFASSNRHRIVANEARGDEFRCRAHILFSFAPKCL